MTYVFDTSAFSPMFRNFYPSVFRSLWENFDELVESGQILSTREVYREAVDSNLPLLIEWVKDHTNLFPTPNVEEAAFVSRIYSVRHFQQNIDMKKLLNGGKVADPFLVARAAAQGSTVVTQEANVPNASKIPNICRHFEIECVNLEGFMTAQGWNF